MFIFSFFNLGPSDVAIIFAAIKSPPERHGDVCRHAISRTPLQLLLRGLLGEGESGQLVLRPRPTHQQ